MYSLADDDKLHEECGVFGIFTPDNKDAKHSLYYGLCALQHRGQESAGMALCDTDGPMGNIYHHKGMGLVSEVFQRRPWIPLQEISVSAMSGTPPPVKAALKMRSL